MINTEYKQEDANTLRYIASELSYNESASEAQIKHRLIEIAMRIETDFYSKNKPKTLAALLKP